MRGARQLAGLADRHEADAEGERDRGGEDEAARLHADDLVDDDVAVLVAATVGERLDHGRESGVVGQQRRDVLEHHARHRIVGYVEDQPRHRVLAACAHFLPRLERGWRVGWTRPADGLGLTGPCAFGTTRPLLIASA